MVSNVKSYRVGTDKIKTTWDLMTGKCNVIYEVKFLDKSGSIVGTNVETTNPVISVTKKIISSQENNAVVSFQVRAKYLTKNGNWTEPQIVSAATATTKLASSDRCDHKFGLIAGGTAGGFVLIIIIVVIVFMMKKKGTPLSFKNRYILRKYFCLLRRRFIISHCTSSFKYLASAWHAKTRLK